MGRQMAQKRLLALSTKGGIMVIPVVINPVSYYFSSGTHRYEIPEEKIEEVMAFLNGIGQHVPNVSNADTHEEPSKEAVSTQEE